MHRTRTMTAAVGALVVVAALAVGCTKNLEAFDSLQRVNAERTAHGLAPLALDDTLVAKAQAWAETMAAGGTVRHSTLTDGVPAGWTSLAENVGSATTVAEMHSLLMASPPHRANILEGRSNRIGTGVATAGGRIYVVQVFAGY